MASYVIAYDLMKPGQKYENVQEVISTISGNDNVEIQKSVWLVKTTLSPAKIRECFSSVLDKNDSFFVCELRKNFRINSDAYTNMKVDRDIF